MIKLVFKLAGLALVIGLCIAFYKAGANGTSPVDEFHHVVVSADSLIKTVRK